VEVISRPVAHADDNTIVRFVDGTNVLFASDWITVHRLPFGQISDVETPMAKAVEAMDFEYFLCSHGALGKKADVTANIRYREISRLQWPKRLQPVKHWKPRRRASRWMPTRTGNSTSNSGRKMWGYVPGADGKINSVTSPLIAGSAAVLVCEGAVAECPAAPLQGWRVTFNSRRC